jgi:DhnA family fructose-bisphosphate aldolase class Ia
MLGDALKEAKGAVADAEKALEARAEGTPEKLKAKPLLDQARHNYDYVVKANGAHNLEYSLELLKKATADAKEAVRLAASAAPAETPVQGSPAKGEAVP